MIVFRVRQQLLCSSTVHYKITGALQLVCGPKERFSHIGLFWSQHKDWQQQLKCLHHFISDPYNCPDRIWVDVLLDEASGMYMKKTLKLPSGYDSRFIFWYYKDDRIAPRYLSLFKGQWMISHPLQTGCGLGAIHSNGPTENCPTEQKGWNKPGILIRPVEIIPSNW